MESCGVGVVGGLRGSMGNNEDNNGSVKRFLKYMAIEVSLGDI
ncbi:uncharacterized protein G2W53_026745 [Senna tora]|uniref:Uncharacterized protein n=1 Tax=Senna tora TaxID=362788 RepID=A0A834TI00_9FABA|nr:uncharacterized protein G2W53_026745 [Senna tora]